MPFLKRAEPRPRSDQWLTTYTDLVTLLFTFFLLLVSLSVTANDRRLSALNSVVGAFGLTQAGQSASGTERAEDIAAESAHADQEAVEVERIRDNAVRNAPGSQIAVLREPERTVLTLGEKVLFNQGSEKIEPQGLKFLSELAEALKKGSSSIELRGFVDPSETSTANDPLKESMMLSTRRAFAVYRFLESEGGIPGQRMVAHGFAPATRTRGIEREKAETNRQVQIILDHREKVPYRVKRPRDAILVDFKGFLFKLAGGDDDR